ncbi:MAG: flagellar assembly protein H, partial [Microcystis sp. Msp_OC_L_20101000_S702]
MKPHDQFAKNYLEQLLSPLGTVEISKEVSDETRQIDVFFSPNPEPNRDYLGLLGRIVLNTVLIEPYRNPPNRSEIRNCLAKLLTILAELQRQAKRENQSYNEDNAPRLWILSPSAGITVLEGFGAKLDPEWPEGVYFLPLLYRTAIIAINQLPVTAETLWLRLLGRGKTQNQAVRELL